MALSLSLLVRVKVTRRWPLMRATVPLAIPIEKDRKKFLLKNPQMAELSKSVALNRNSMNYLWVRVVK